MRSVSPCLILLISLSSAMAPTFAQSTSDTRANSSIETAGNKTSPRAVRNLLSRIQVHRKRAIQGLIGPVANGPVAFLSDEANAEEKIRKSPAQLQAAVKVLNDELDRIVKDDTQILPQVIMTADSPHSPKDDPRIKAFLAAYKLSFRMMVENCSKVVDSTTATVESLDGSDLATQKAKISIQKTLDEFKANLELNATLFDVARALLIQHFSLTVPQA